MLSLKGQSIIFLIKPILAKLANCQGQIFLVKVQDLVTSTRDLAPGFFHNWSEKSHTRDNNTEITLTVIYYEYVQMRDLSD